MTSSTNPARRMRIQGVVLLALTFIVGVLAGGATERIRASRGKPLRPFGEMAELPPPFMRLGLTEEQRVEISAIFERGRPQTDSVLRELMPHLQAIQDSIRTEIRNILTLEQAEQLDAEYERRGMRRAGMEWRWRRPFPPDSPPGGQPRRLRPER